MTLETPRELLEAISSPHIDAPRIPPELLEATTKLTQSSLIRNARHISRTQQLLQSPSSIHQSRSSTIILNNSNTLVPNTPPPSSTPTPLLFILSRSTGAHKNCLLHPFSITANPIHSIPIPSGFPPIPIHPAFPPNPYSPFPKPPP